MPQRARARRALSQADRRGLERRHQDRDARHQRRTHRLLQAGSDRRRSARQTAVSIARARKESGSLRRSRHRARLHRQLLAPSLAGAQRHSRARRIAGGAPYRVSPRRCARRCQEGLRQQIGARRRLRLLGSDDGQQSRQSRRGAQHHLGHVDYARFAHPTAPAHRQRSIARARSARRVGEQPGNAQRRQRRVSRQHLRRGDRAAQ